MLARRLLPSTKTMITVTRTAIKSAKDHQSLPLLARGLTTASLNKKEAGASAVHFRVSATPHPLGNKAKVDPNKDLGDHIGRQQNHIWSEDELKEKLSKLYHHKPKTITDQIVHKTMYGLYHTFNFVTGYRAVDPPVKAIEWRLIVLESIAGVPGFIAAGFRHFRSLRTLNRDYGWIPTLLEEAENERMHLLICLDTFQANFATRLLVVAAQTVMAPLLATIYFFKPSAMHRFVGYLEETACKTYLNIIDHLEKDGTLLNKEWGNTPAPDMAKGYYRLPDNAKWIDALKCMMADETHHRDVNHTFADMKSDDPNPFITMHKEDAMIAWRLNEAGEPAWSPKVVPAQGFAGKGLEKAGLRTLKE